MVKKTFHLELLLVVTIQQFKTQGNKSRRNSISWDKVDKAVRYRLYKLYNGAYGIIASTEAQSFDDVNILPDTTISPPRERSPFGDKNSNNTNTFSAAVAFYEQRLVFASSKERSQTLWTSGTANIYNFSTSIPVKADEAITYTFIL